MAAKEFLHQFYPKIMDVTHRTPSFWQRSKYHFLRASAQVYNLAFIQKGEGRIILDGQSFDLKPGSLFHISPGLRMEIVTSREAPLEYYGVLFYQMRIQWEGTEFQASPSDAALPLPRVIALPGSELHGEIQAMHALWHAKEASYEWQTKLALLSLLDRLFDAALAVQEGRTPDSLRQVKEIVAYIRDHYAEPLDRTVLAEAAAMSVSHFSALFKTAVGISPQRFVEKVRIDQAKTLLMSTGIPVGEVAKAVGYGDPLYFTRVFTKVTGLSPREYRGGI
jgi:AraC-like DNA-binding protein